MSVWATKPLLLPSNGLFYDSLISLKEPDLFLINQIQSSFYSSSETEFLYFIISRYTDFKDPKTILFNDAYFIWMYIFNMLNDKNEHIMTKSNCNFCKHENQVKTNLSSADLIKLEKNSNKYLTYENNDYIFTYEYRTLKHNIETGYMELDIEDKNNFIEILYSYFYPQCINIYNKNTKTDYDSSFLKEALNTIRYKNLLDLFNSIKNEKWGLDNVFYFTCSNCFKDVNVSVGDSFSYSIFNINKTTNSKMKDLIYLASLKILSFKEILNIPLSEWNNIYDAIVKIQKEKSGVKNFLDEVSDM
jgi:transposase-like protein